MTITKLAAEVMAALKILNPERKHVGGKPMQVHSAQKDVPEVASLRDPTDETLERLK
jgi:hypothetical protein